MEAPRHDTRGIVDPSGLLNRVRFRRHEPAEPLRRYVEWYWLIDWDLPAPYASHIVAHPAVNLTFQWDGADETEAPPYAEVTGVALGLYTRKLSGRGRVCGVKFRPGGFRPYAPEAPVSGWTGRALPAQEVFPQATGDAAHAIVTPAEDHARVAALDTFLHSLPCTPDPQADLAMSLVQHIRTDRTVRRVGDFARAEGLSVRALQRLFSTYVGVSPKWVILRYRIHEALEHAGTRTDVDWATLATELGYADQAHLVRDFTATVGVPPAAYAADARSGGAPGDTARE
ncbi:MULTISPECIES: helix-turn-helix domain-containing protein [unclassified Streptomyces]|uniref:helix-turn-helix domain-containing protein n=1 Tax=unclassified Streptomyces TaxID=2593676 RepID=UPI002365D4BB|nr:MULTISPECIES: helix-turn-helix domain-containing protein [unclassified Streptomyces]MDF3141951.1 helix-turn-helix domain-containing protein [Streptomyces sp. T21Q-yed]WDF40342.1 helix-turn-helix domain-containing protein [Streptomyces sp. T12]